MARWVTNVNIDRPSTGVANKLGDIVLARMVDRIVHGSTIDDEPSTGPYMGLEGEGGLTVVRSRKLVTPTKCAYVG